jgi:hypothetical protein
MENLCFTERSLQFFEFMHKSLGSSISLSPLFLFSLAPSSFSHCQHLSLAPSLSPPRFSPSLYPLPGPSKQRVREQRAEARGAGRGRRPEAGGCSRRGRGHRARGAGAGVRRSARRWSRRACPCERLVAALWRSGPAGAGEQVRSVQRSGLGGAGGSRQRAWLQAAVRLAALA